MKIFTTLKIVIWISIMVFFIGCKNEIKFDSAEWNKNGVDWQITEYREKMVSDLIKSDTLIGLDKISVIEVLGKPEIETEKKLKYLVREKYEWNIDPEYIKYLWVILDENGIATKCYVEKTK
ncbi:hypothetical protein [Maribacter dokdonensis]|uniref:hypothetical protein n=1 Tax=Maribacter dokdonensis TaxID=320912 RepID=UPI0012F7498A|nr:hypothetical protein [Maribacter dokdonensis]